MPKQRKGSESAEEEPWPSTVQPTHPRLRRRSGRGRARQAARRRRPWPPSAPRFNKYRRAGLPRPGIPTTSQLDFARNFGPLETTVFKARKDHKLRLRENLADVGNPDAENRILETSDRQRLYNLGNRLWHATPRSSACRPAARCCAHARSRRSAACTEFADMRAAYDALPRRPAAAHRRAWWPSIRSRPRAPSRASPTSTRPSAEAVRAGAEVLGAACRTSGRVSLYVAHAGAIRGKADDRRRRSCSTSSP